MDDRNRSGIPSSTNADPVGIITTRKVVVCIPRKVSTRSYQIAHLLQIAKAAEEVLGTLSTFVQTGLALAYLADQAQLSYRARRVIAEEREQEVEDAEIVSEMESLVEKIDITEAMKQARKATVRFKIPEDEPQH